MPQVFFLTVFEFKLYSFFHVIFKKYSFGGYPFFKIFKKYSFLLYSFSLILVFFSKSIRLWFIPFERLSEKEFVSGVFDNFFLKFLVWGLFVMIIFQKVYVQNLCVFVFFSKSIRLRFIRFVNFFRNVFVLGYSFFQTNKVKVIRFSKNVYIQEKRLKKKTYGFWTNFAY